MYAKPIAKTNNFIILDKFEKYDYVKEHTTGYQSENGLENELIKDLVDHGFIYRDDIKNHESLLNNVREKIEKLNNIKFSNSEWKRFVKEYLDNPSDGVIEKTRKVHDDYIYDFIFDNGMIKNIYLFDKENISRNSVEVIRQFTQIGDYLNRYDVTVLVNGLPLVHIELKRRGIAIKEAFNQIDRYKRESFFNKNSLFKYIQIFVISNGTDTRYFANTTKREKNSFDFTINWATADNKPIKELKDFTATFFEKRTLLEVIFKYSVFDVNNTLLIMRPYQIAATERILWKIKSSYENKQYGSVEGGGYIWHTTGSGKTLTSFKTAQLATKLDFIDKVFFVVDRKDLDYQTMKEYQRFSPDSVNGSENTAGLKKNILKQDNKIIVTTIQKLNNLLKSEKDLEIYNRHVVFIFDEAHRSQFGEAQKNLKKRFKKYYQFGFTGTPIFAENALGSETTASVFGVMLHSYVITDAIRDEKVLKFKVDYNNVKPKFKDFESEKDLEKLLDFETKEALLHPERIKEIATYILENFDKKTHRKYGQKQFNALFAVSSVDAAKLYYETFQKLQANLPNPLKIATIFSYKQNEESSIGEIEDEGFEVSALNLTAKEFLASAIDDYNKMFKTNFKIDSSSFQNYYRDVSKRVEDVEIDLLIVVGMFLTGFDAVRLNTLFVDKNLRYHGLIQAYSRTNRIYNKTKAFGNIVTFRDLEQATIDAIRLFGDKNSKNIILEKSYQEYLNGFEDTLTKEKKRGFIDIIDELQTNFSNPAEIEKDSEKKEFVKLFSEYLKIENILQNFDEYYAMKALQKVDVSNSEEVEKIKEKYHIDDKVFEEIKNIKLLDERKVQDYLSVYHDIREWIKIKRESEKEEKTEINWDDVVFEVDLLKSQEINLDYILELIFEKNRFTKNKNELIEEIKRVIKASVGHRAKEELIVKFINSYDLDEFKTAADVIEAFFNFAKEEMEKEKVKIIREENLKEEIVNRYLKVSLKRGYASENGEELNRMLPQMSPLNPNYLKKKRGVFEKLSRLVEKFRGI